MGFLTAGLFFWRFWQKTSDSLFIAFGLAFLLFAIDQFVHALEGASTLADWAFFFRLTGFRAFDLRRDAQKSEMK